MNVNMVFALLFAIIIIMVVLFFGTTQFGNLININSETTFYNDMNKFDGVVAKVASMSLDSEQKFDFKLSGNTEKVCFVNRNRPDSNPEGGWKLTNILEHIITDGDYNLLIFEKGKDVPTGRRVDYLIPESNFCIKARKTLWLVNKGRYVSIEE